MSLSKILVQLQHGREYPIIIGDGLITRLGSNLLIDLVRSKNVSIITNKTIESIYLDDLVKLLQEQKIDIKCKIIIEDGEIYKSWETLNLIFAQLAQAYVERSTFLLALGGGVVGDITGFAAACYMRGVPYIQIPTTLLAQVDSSVGGKTAVNHASGKNMIGAFYQPSAVLIDISTLKTQSERDFRSGLAEVIKYGLIRDIEFFEWLEHNIHLILQRDQSALCYLITKSCQNKAQIVGIDEHESQERMLLNLGHTFGHAIEHTLGYGSWLHGEAVAVGILMAADLSKMLGWLSSSDTSRIRNLFEQFSLVKQLPCMDVTQFVNSMKNDKKVASQKNRFVLLKKLGEAVIFDQIDGVLLNKLVESYCYN